METSIKKLTTAIAVVFALAFSTQAFADRTLRVATWNIQKIGAPGDSEYEAALAVIGRIRPNVIAIEEVTGKNDLENLQALATALGYPYWNVSPFGIFGGLATAFLSDMPIANSKAWSSLDLSPDPLANDLTRYIHEANIDVEGAGGQLKLFALHLKSGSSNTDDFRRALESLRVSQAVSKSGPVTPMMIMGDLNSDIGDGPLSPPVFTSIPGGLPASFVVGSDVQTLVSTSGLLNNPFTYLTSYASVLYAPQLDGSSTTRPSTGRRIDYILANNSVISMGATAQVYDCSDEQLTGGLPLYGFPLSATVCPTASDHLPVFADVVIPSGGSPAFDLSPSSVDFANQIINTTGTRVITLYSSGSKSLTINSVAFGNGGTGGVGGQFSVNSGCQGTIASGNSCQIQIGFTPSSLGAQSTTLNVETNAGKKSVPITGYGIPIPMPVYPAPTATLSVRITRGQGTITSNPLGIECPSAACSYNFTRRTKVRLTAAPIAGGKFAGWSGACSGRKLVCTVTLKKNSSVKAKFK